MLNQATKQLTIEYPEELLWVVLTQALTEASLADCIASPGNHQALRKSCLFYFSMFSALGILHELNQITKEQRDEE
jgi:hypothetical protein